MKANPLGSKQPVPWKIEISDKPGGQSQDVGALHFSAAQQDVLQDLGAQQAHGQASLAHVAKLLDRVGHPLVPVAVVVQRRMPAAHNDPNSQVLYFVSKSLRLSGAMLH